jgi:hypothetical protein
MEPWSKPELSQFHSKVLEIGVCCFLFTSSKPNCELMNMNGTVVCFWWGCCTKFVLAGRMTGKKRTYIDCPYNEKDEAKALGAKWDHIVKLWYFQADIVPSKWPFVNLDQPPTSTSSATSQAAVSINIVTTSASTAVVSSSSSQASGGSLVLNKMKIAELKDELSKRSLKIGGNKDELVARLADAVASETWGTMNLTDLKAECKGRSLQVSGKKEELLARLKASLIAGSGDSDSSSAGKKEDSNSIKPPPYVPPSSNLPSEKEPAPTPVSSAVPSTSNSYTLSALKDICKEKGLKVTGNKTELAQRIVEANHQAREKLSLAELKDQCKAKGVKVTGNKTELMNRLKEHDITTFGSNTTPTVSSAPVPVTTDDLPALQSVNENRKRSLDFLSTQPSNSKKPKLEHP